MCDACGWVTFLEEIDDHLEDDDFSWAVETLEGIRETVARNEHCTDGQKVAVDNIADAVMRH